jgi:hypothetical protein
MKLIYSIIIVSISLACVMCKNTTPISSTKTEYSISLITFNHAELLTGMMNYKLKNDSFTITLQSRFEQQDTILFSKKIEGSLVKQIVDIKLDTMKNLYFNNCIMITSGQEYWISIKRDTTSKNIQLHHFYHNQVEQLIRNINKVVPEEYKIEYLPLDTKQDCEY